MRKPGIFGITAAVFAFLFFAGCDLFNNKPEIYLEETMDAEIAWANAPYVAVLVEEGGLGTASPGLAGQTGGERRVPGVSDKRGEESGADTVKFVPLNVAGTEVEIFIYVKPEGRITIGPLGADNPELSLRVDEGGTGTASPRGLVSGVRLDFPFQVSFLPNADYDFYGWQVRREGSGDLMGSWATGAGDQRGDVISFDPQNITGTEIRITIHENSGAGTIIVEPLNGNNPFLVVELDGGGLGTISPTGTVTGIKQGFGFSVSYLAGSAYPFSGWQARYEGEWDLLASWTGEGASGTDAVVFTPVNITETELKITILINPVTAEGTPKKIVIGPLGADSAVLEVEVQAGGMGTISPQGTVSGIRLGFPFTISYQPDSAYPFLGWQAKVAGKAEAQAVWTGDSKTGMDKVSFKPQNLMGTEVQVSILKDPGGKLTIGPLGADYPEVTVRVAYPEGWGRSPQYGVISPRPRQGISFDVSFTAAGTYGFAGWRACRSSDYQEADTTVFLDASAVLITEGTEGAASVTVNIEGDITLIP